MGKALSDIPVLKPYWGKPAVRNFRGGDGNVGIIRSPVRAIALPDCTKPLTRRTLPRVRDHRLTSRNQPEEYCSRRVEKRRLVTPGMARGFITCSLMSGRDYLWWNTTTGRGRTTASTSTMTAPPVTRGLSCASGWPTAGSRRLPLLPASAGRREPLAHGSDWIRVTPLCCCAIPGISRSMPSTGTLRRFGCDQGDCTQYPNILRQPEGICRDLSNEDLFRLSLVLTSGVIYGEDH